MEFYLTSSQYNGISALTDMVGARSLSWLDFIQLYGNVTIVENDLLALQQQSLPYYFKQNIPAFEWAEAIPLITQGINSLTLDLGAITGIFIIGETVTQATSGATGIVYSVVNGVPNVMVVNGVTGNFDTTHLITGGTSGATSTPSALLASPSIPAYNNLAYIFGANITGEETSQNPFTFSLVPDFTFEYAEPFTQNVNFYAVFSNLRAKTSATFALNYINGTPINTQNVTTDGDGTAVVQFNTGVLVGGTTEIQIVVTQQVSDALTGMRGAISMTRTLYAQVS